MIKLLIMRFHRYGYGLVLSFLIYRRGYGLVVGLKSLEEVAKSETMITIDNEGALNI